MVIFNSYFDITRGYISWDDLYTTSLFHLISHGDCFAQKYHLQCLEMQCPVSNAQFFWVCLKYKTANSWCLFL